MRTINVYEIGVDPLPIVGLEINYWERSYSYDFVSDDLKFGIVRVALPKGMKKYKPEDVHIEPLVMSDDGEWDVFDDLGNPLKPILYIDHVENSIERGMHWMYYHEYINSFGSDIFPFQESDAFNAAVKAGIVKKISESTSVMEKGSAGDNRPECNLYYTKVICEYNSKAYKLNFSSTRKSDLYENLYKLDELE
ncbi:hypothetical protein ZPAH1_orf00397 [Aeromonas phage ZPAH1]|nr:hypothetical protein ZPAH1_orf00397 [Aeromonas phage ZPAH1]